MKISKEVIAGWVGNKKRTQDTLNRIKKRLKKLHKKEKHFEMRVRLIAEFEKNNDQTRNVTNLQKDSVGVSETVP